MPNPSLARVARSAVARSAGPEWSDGRLLGRYVAARDEAAFAGLVARHGPMVLAVCRRVAGDPHLADDAFQAAFLVLARRASAVTPREAVRGWLYGVAVRTAREARHMAARRRRREVPVPIVPDRAAVEKLPTDADALRALDEEVGRLAEPLRTAVVLCELDGLSRRDAAARLGIPEGTLSSRLAKARKQLAARLRSRGVSAPAVGLGMAVPVPAALADAAAGLGGASPVPAAVSELTRRVFRTMLLSKLKLATLPVTAVVLAAGVIAGAGGPVRSDDPPLNPVAVAKPADPPPTLAAKPADPPAAVPPTPAKPLGPGRLVVARNGVPADDVWSADPDGGRAVSLRHPAGTAYFCPRLSPDGRRVAFVAWKVAATKPKYAIDESVVVHDPSGLHPDVQIRLGRLTDSHHHIAWSADGTRLVACGGRPGSSPPDRAYWSWLIDPVTGSKTCLELPESVFVQTWGPGTDTLLVRRPCPEGTELAVIGIDGRTVKSVLRRKGVAVGRLSPDGTKVLLPDRDPNEPAIPDKEHVGQTLFVLDVATNTRTRIPTMPKILAFTGTAWSPDGRRIAFTCTTYDQFSRVSTPAGQYLRTDFYGQKSHLVVCDADGANPKTLLAETSQQLRGLDWR